MISTVDLGFGKGYHDKEGITKATISENATINAEVEGDLNRDTNNVQIITKDESDQIDADLSIDTDIINQEYWDNVANTWTNTKILGKNAVKMAKKTYNAVEKLLNKNAFNAKQKIAVEKMLAEQKIIEEKIAENIKAEKDAIAEEKEKLHKENQELIDEMNAITKEVFDVLKDILDTSTDKETIKIISDLGQLSAKFESNGDPGAIGYDKNGGWSYGSHQIASNTGSMGEFLTLLKKENTKMYDILEAAGGIKAAKAGNETFKKTWKELAKNPEFNVIQKKYTDAENSVAYTNIKKRRC